MIPSPSAPIAIGLVGLGKIALDQHVPALRANPAFRIAGTSSTSGGSLDGVPAFPSTEAMLAGAALDAVAVLTPPGPRHAIARAALLAGKAVLLEKPPASTTSELADLAALAGVRNLPLFTTWHARENGAVDEARARLAGRRVTRLTVTWHEDVRRWHPGQEWVFGAGAFGVFDPGINAFSILTAILPAALFVRGATLSFPRGRDAPIAAEVTFGTGEEGFEGTASLDWRRQGEQLWEIAVEAEGIAPLKLTRGGARLEQEGAPAVEGRGDEYPRLYARFAELVRAGRGEVDEAPLRLAADAFLVARRAEVEPFSF